LFLNPQTQDWETEDQYLSGNVREKLEAAEAAALTESRFKENVEALKSVQPEDLSATDIDARLGACWIPVKDVEKFVQELLGADDVTVKFTPQLGAWTVQAGYNAKASVANATDWGTNRATALELIEDALNLRTPTIYDKVRDGKSDKQVVNPDATEAAREKQQKIKDRFKEWIWQDDEQIQPRIQLHPSPRLQRRPSDVARCQRDGGLAFSPEDRCVAHSANPEHALGPRRRGGQNLYNGCRRDGIEAAGFGAQTDVHGSQSHAWPVFL
jgi:hypothetical protein